MRIAEFAREVKLETMKILWPTRKESLMTCVMVLFITAISGVFFLLIDSAIYKIIQFILGI